MRDSPTQNKSRHLLLAWAVVATFVGITFIVISILLFSQLRSLKTVCAVAGRYKWIEEGKSHGIITLLPDHSFISPNGGKATTHQWEIEHEALLVFWLSGIDRFTKVESSGVYIATRPDGRVVRMEREQL